MNSLISIKQILYLSPRGNLIIITTDDNRLACRRRALQKEWKKVKTALPHVFFLLFRQHLDELAGNNWVSRIAEPRLPGHGKVSVAERQTSLVACFARNGWLSVFSSFFPIPLNQPTLKVDLACVRRTFFLSVYRSRICPRESVASFRGISKVAVMVRKGYLSEYASSVTLSGGTMWSRWFLWWVFYSFPAV